MPGRREGEIRGILWLAGASILWGTTGTTRALAPQDVHPLALGAARLALASAFLVAWAIARGGSLRGPWPRPPLVVAALGIASYQATFFVGVQRLGVATGTMVAIGSAPVLAGIVGRVARGERLGARWAGATALASVGLVLLVRPSADLDLLGIAAALAAGLSYAVYAAASKTLIERRGPDAAMAGAFGLAAIVSLPLLLLPGTLALATPRGAIAILHLSLLATAVAYALFARGMRTLRVGTAATVSLLEPATAATLGVLVLGETLGRAGLAGVACVLLGVLLLALPRRDIDALV